MGPIDATDARILLALDASPRAPVIEVAARVGLARRTVQHRLGRLEEEGLLQLNSTRAIVDNLGFRVRAVISAEVQQDHLAPVVEDLARRSSPVAWWK
ncbi:winged helix-turn-helix transcriptional regulator [uncultured Nocardioides sp.]|uniref:Lrp/AsnC family transcriptional regulator n=1 Tax=uncultured Nocardioides sp. TaxID=198441 RepID=UPI00262BB15C|nr:winged helix-turn-helix transcriptional regulator [uncultured Nocardioides sp.]